MARRQGEWGLISSSLNEQVMFLFGIINKIDAYPFSVAAITNYHATGSLKGTTVLSYSSVGLVFNVGQWAGLVPFGRL